jgi:hypothetical protein
MVVNHLSTHHLRWVTYVTHLRWVCFCANKKVGKKGFVYSFYYELLPLQQNSVKIQRGGRLSCLEKNKSSTENNKKC